jgi:hypothetical protein
MPAKVPAGTKRTFKEKGSKQNGGRPITVTRTKQKDGTWKTTSQNTARAEYEKKNGKLPKDTDVDHKNNRGRAGDDRQSNLQAMSHKKNVAKENRRRAGKK